MRRLDDVPRAWAEARGAAVALSDAGRAYTWEELERWRRALAQRLATLGIRAGDRVVVVGENSAPLVALLFAIVSLDAWVVNVNARLAPREVDGIVGHCSPRCVLFLAATSGDALAHAQRHDAAPLGDATDASVLRTAVNAHSVPETVPGDPAANVAALIYTTGTTGNPKGVMLTHANLLFIASLSARLRHLSPEDRVYGLLPIAHVYGLASVCLGTLLAGASVHLQARFAPQAMAEFLARERISVCQGVPAMYAKLLEYLKGQGHEHLRPGALRALYAGGSPLAPALKHEVETFFGLPLHNGYGLTEASPTIAQTRYEAPRSDCSVGHVVPGVEVRIVDAAGHDVAAGEPGELWARGPNVMKGYYRDPEATAIAIRSGGWLATGDIARQGSDGALHIEGRLKELIIRSGFNVYPVEVEAVLNAHPEVTQSAVLGRKTPSDEEVVAFVELVPGARATPAALLQFAAAALAPYKRPTEIIVMASLPAAANGKVLKGRLMQLVRGA